MTPVMNTTPSVMYPDGSNADDNYFHVLVEDTHEGGVTVRGVDLAVWCFVEQQWVWPGTGEPMEDTGNTGTTRVLSWARMVPPTVEQMQGV